MNSTRAVLLKRSGVGPPACLGAEKSLVALQFTRKALCEPRVAMPRGNVSLAAAEPAVLALLQRAAAGWCCDAAARLRVLALALSREGAQDEADFAGLSADEIMEVWAPLASWPELARHIAERAIARRAVCKRQCLEVQVSHNQHLSIARSSVTRMLGAGPVAGR